jgi:hypothetical protein
LNTAAATIATRMPTKGAGTIRQLFGVTELHNTMTTMVSNPI